MVTSPCQPEPQSDVLVKAAVDAAADAGRAIQAVPAAATTAATARMSVRLRRMGDCLRGRGTGMPKLLGLLTGNPLIKIVIKVFQKQPAHKESPADRGEHD